MIRLAYYIFIINQQLGDADREVGCIKKGKLSYFIEFLKTADLFDPWVKDRHLTRTNPNASQKRNILGN